MKSHKFSVDDAVNHGVQKALLLEHLKFHQENNEGIHTYEIEGKVWCHAKRENLKKMYPYFSGRSISRWLQELEDDGIIESQKPKIKRSDHTKYYRVIGYREALKGNGQNGQSTKTQETDIKSEESAFKSNETNGQNGQSNGQNGRSMNGQNGQSTIYNYSEETIVKGPRANVVKILKGFTPPPPAKKLFEIDGFFDAYIDYWVYMKSRSSSWPNEIKVKKDYLKLVELMSDGNDPVKVINQTIHGDNKSFYPLRDFNEKSGSSDHQNRRELNPL